jgi:hypothetical protein
MHRPQLRLISSRTERVSRLTADLAGVSERLRIARAPHEVMKLLVEDVGDACGASGAAVYLQPDGAEKPALAKATDFRSGSRSRNLIIPFARTSPLVAAVRTGRAHWFRNRSALVAAFAAGDLPTALHPIESLAVLPLIHQGNILGAFVIAYTDQHLLSDHDLEFLLVTVNLAAQALARAFRRGPGRPPAIDGQGPVCFQLVSSGERRIQPRKRRKVDLARLVRKVARRQLTSAARPAGTLTCAPRGPVFGYWDRRWLEATVDGVLELACRLADAPIQLDVWSDGDSAIVDAVHAAPASRAEHVDLAAMTLACEEWTLVRWLWQGVAAQQGARVTVLQDDSAPRGVRLRLPSSGDFLLRC